MDKLPHLDNVNSVFGRLIYGTSVLELIEEAPVDKKNRPTEAIEIESITVHANPFAEMDA